MMRVTNILVLMGATIIAGQLAKTEAQTVSGVLNHMTVNPVSARPAMTRKASSVLKEIFKDSIEGSHLRLPEEDKIADFKHLMKKTISSQSISTELSQQWKRDGWECRSVADSNVIVITEKSNQRWGRGLYMVRPESVSRIVLQAPHRFNDAKTGVITRKIFQEHDVWAVGFNTVHRKELDLAHCDRHYFNAFTEAVMEVRSEAITLQLHGFSNATKTNAGKTAHLIVSDTNKFPGRYARRVAEEFKVNFGKSHTRLFPIETRWLGGTDNRQAKLVQQSGSTGFLHFEMNPEFRQQLASNASIRKLFFASALAGVAQ